MPKFLILIWLWAVLPFPQVEVQHFTELQRLGNGALGDVAFSPDGTRVAVGTSLGVAVYDTSGNELVSLPEQYPGAASRLVWSNDGNWLAIEDVWLLGYIPPRYFKTLTLWEPGTNKTLSIPLETTSTFSILFSPDSTQLAVSTDSGVDLFDTASGELLYHLHDPVMDSANIMQQFSIAFSPDSSQFATSGDEILIWDTATGEPEKRLPAPPASCLIWSEYGLLTNWETAMFWDVENETALSTIPGSYDCAFSDGRYFISGWADSQVTLFDLTTNSEGYQVTSPEPLDEALFSGDLLLTRSGSTVRVWSGETMVGETIFSMQDFGLNEFYGDVLDWSPDGRWAAIRQWVDPGIDRLVLWNVETDSNQGDFPAFTERFVGVSWFVPEAVWVDATSNGHEFMSYEWELATGEITQTNAAIGEWGGEEVDPLILFNGTNFDGTRTITTDIHGMIRVYDAADTSTPLIEIQSDDVAYTADLSMDGRYLAAGGNDIRIWDTETGDLLVTLDGHQSAVTDVAWSMEGDKLASVGADGILIIWGAP